MLLVLFWECQEAMDESFTVFVHLLDAHGRVLVGHDSLPAAGMRPTTSWLSGEIISDEHRLDLAGKVPPGRYSLAVGLYQAGVPGYPRVPVKREGTSLSGDQVVIYEIEVAD